MINLGNVLPHDIVLIMLTDIFMYTYYLDVCRHPLALRHNTQNQQAHNINHTSLC